MHVRVNVILVREIGSFHVRNYIFKPFESVSTALERQTFKGLYFIDKNFFSWTLSTL